MTSFSKLVLMSILGKSLGEKTDIYMKRKEGIQESYPNPARSEYVTSNVNRQPLEAHMADQQGLRDRMHLCGLPGPLEEGTQASARPTSALISYMLRNLTDTCLPFFVCFFPPSLPLLGWFPSY